MKIFFTSTILVLSIIFSANAQLDFERLKSLPNLGAGDEISSGDFDGDGDKDIIFSTTDFYPAVYAIQNNLGNYSEEPIQVTSLFTDSPNVFYSVPFIVLDFDNDGKDEVVVYDQVDNGGTERIIIYKYDGENFVIFKKLTTTNDFSVRQLRHGDINKDGKVDFLYSTNIANKIYYLESNSNNSYSLKDFSTNPNFPNQFVLGDMDGDDWPDIIQFDMNFKITIHRNNQNGGFTFNQNLGASFTTITKIVISDLNNDDKNDIVVLGNNTDYIELFTQNSGNTYTSSQITFNGTSGTDILVYDYNNDLKQDILLSGSINVPFTQRGFIMLDNTDNGFDLSFYTEPSLSPVRLIHVEGGPNPKILTMNSGKNILIHTREPSAIIFENNIPFGSIFDFSRTTDLNKDGYDDIVATNVFGNSITIYYGIGDGTYNKPKYLLTEGPPYDLEIADFNNDGMPDIIYSIGTSPSANVGLLLTDIQGNLSISKTFSGSTGYHMVVNDFNKDGFTDFFNGSTINYGSSTGNFIDYSPGINSVSSITTGDFNADGYGDLAIGTSSGIVILTGKSGYIMDEWQNILTSDPVSEIVTSNLNQDQYNDLIVLTSGGHAIQYINNNGTFTETNLTISGTPLKTVTADFNKDNFVDIAILADNNKINLLTGNGSGSFILFNTYSTNQDFFKRLHVSNVNSDLIPDLVLIPSVSGSVALMLNDLVIEPTQKPNAITINNITDVDALISLTQGDGNGRIVLIREKVNNSTEPVDNIFYVADSKFGSGSKLGNNNFVVLAANNNSVNVTNLNEGTEYEITAYEYSSNSKKTIINYLTSAFAIGSFKTKKSQTINPLTISTKTQTDLPFAVTATATSGLSVIAELVSGGVTVSNNLVTIVNPGPVKIKFSQPGNSEFAPALNLEVTFCVNPVTPSITYAAASNGKYTLTSSSATNNVWLKNNTVIADETNMNIEVTPDATYNVKVDYSGCSNNSASISSQIITFPEISDKEEGQSNFSVNASSSSLLPIKIEIISGSATIENNNVTFLSPGPVKIKASQEGSTIFFPAIPVEQIFCINPKKPTVTRTDGEPGKYILTSSSDTNNIWLINNTIINGATSKNYEPIVDGIYSVTVNYSGCFNTSLPTINLITGIEEVLSSLSIYPNPSSDIVIIEWPNKNPQIDDLVICDSQGKKNKVNYKQIENAIMVDIQDLNPGFFTILLKTTKGSAFKKIIKN